MLAATLLPSFAVHLIVALPAFRAVTLPVELTFATVLSLLLQVTFLFVALDGAATAFNSMLLPSFTLLLPEIVSFLTGCFTVTLQVSFLPLPSAAVQVTVQVPLPTAVSRPLLSTVATLVLLLL